MLSRQKKEHTSLGLNKYMLISKKDVMISSWRQKEKERNLILHQIC